ncbi:MAG: MoxR family ATPase [Pseudomonadota bacterium]|nr:MoxR family ATPase [Pseudomonadota bacterium]
MTAAPLGADALGSLRALIERRVVGKPEVIELALVCVLAGGHLLLEDVPGVGKTTLGLTIARALGGRFKRVQFTSDLLPSDILGATVLDPRSGTFTFRPGPLFANVVLADEINRTTPRTQSALLEAMNEGQVSVDGETLPLPDPFLVIATQNPHEYQGTWPLPDSQLDRFLVRTSMGYPSREAERAILRGEARFYDDDRPITADALAALRADVARVRVHAELEDYVLDLVAATRGSPALARGVSTRGAEALLRASRALARLRGREWVVPEDIRSLAVPVLAHRVLPRAETGDDAGAAAIRGLLAGLTPPI